MYVMHAFTLTFSSPDLSYAKVFITVLGNSVERRQVYVWLCANAGRVKFALAKRLKHMKRVPDLHFKLADSQAAADLAHLMDELGDERMAGVRGEGGEEEYDEDSQEFEEDEDSQEFEEDL